MPTCRSWKTGLEFWKWRPYKVRSLVSNSIYAKKDRNGLCVQSWKCSSGITMDPFLGSTYHFEARELWWPPTGWHVSHWRGVRQMLLQTAGSCDFPPVTAWGLYRKFAAIVHSKHYCSDIHLSADGDTLYTSLYSGILAETEVLSSYSSIPLV